MEDLTELVEVKPDDAFILHPGEFVLGSTLEQIGIPDDLAARLEGKSSLGRLGLMTHSTAGFLDPGFIGHVTLELSNVANLPITLYPGMRIGQIAVFQLTTAADRPYGSRGVGSKYQGQRGPTPSPYRQNFRPPLPRAHPVKGPRCTKLSATSAAPTTTEALRPSRGSPVELTDRGRSRSCTPARAPGPRPGPARPRWPPRPGAA